MPGRAEHIPRRYVEEVGEVVCVTMGATEAMLGEWEFGLPAGSMEEEPIIMATLAASQPDGLPHIGFGLGIPGMNDALNELGWMPPRYTTAAFQFAATSVWWREQLARRPEYFFPVYCHDVGRLTMTALSNTRPLTDAGVKQALEKVKMLPAATGARYIRHGWVGSEFLVGRRVLPDASDIGLHGTIEGLLEPPVLS